MEFNEFRNPEEKDYDINVSVDNNYGVLPSNGYSEMLAEMIGVLEDISEEDLLNDYGITLYEYLNPNEEVINKVKTRLEERAMHK